MRSSLYTFLFMLLAASGLKANTESGIQYLFPPDSTDLSFSWADTNTLANKDTIGNELATDTLENESTILAEIDTLVTDFSKIDHDLIADRLQCIENEIPLTYFRPVQNVIEFYIARKHVYSERLLARSAFYFPIFEEYLKKYDLPEELKYLAVVESALVPNAVSRSGAVGLWQFMPLTGRELGLRVDGIVDERRDIHKSTEAACRYLKRLYNSFGDWELALASYNCGPGYVRRAIRRAGYKKSYQDIYRFLPRETRAYVPSFVAVAYAFNYAEEHHLHVHPDSVLQMALDTIEVEGYVNLKKFSLMLDEPYEKIKEYNPFLMSSFIPSGYGKFVLNIPSEKKECFELYRKEILDSASLRNAERIVHTVRSGNSIGSIANLYGVTVRDIKAWNGLSSNLIHPGDKLIVWKPEGRELAKAVLPKPKYDNTGSSKSYANKKVYIVQPGDTLWDISRVNSITIDKIMQLNNLRTKDLRPGQRLIIG